MIDANTGSIDLSDERITSNLTRKEFLSLTMGKQAKIFVQNEPYCSFRIEAKLGADDFILVLWFEGQTLNRVTLQLSDDRYGSSWDDWTEENELARKQAHDDWLKAHGLSKQYPWGKILSLYDSRGGSSTIEIVYQR